MTGSTSAYDARKSFVDWLQRHPYVDDLDFSRDGYQTVLLELGNPEPEELVECEVCGAVGLRERIEDGHDCRDFRPTRENGGMER